jgi:outer membrane biosynthesis protein TonB
MDSTIRSRSAILTLLIHAAILLAMIFWAMTISNPPFPEAGGGGGVLVNIGYLESASGDVQPLTEKTTTTPQPEKVKPSPSSEEKVVTQNNEEAIAVAEAKKEKAKHEIKVVKTEAPPVKEVVKVERSADPNALYSGKNNSSKSQGTAATGTGDQGEKTGDPNANYNGGKSGSGSGPGSGTGTGGGNGSGNGPGTGGGNTKGISFDLSGRRLILKPVVDDRSQEEGRVVVSITVNKDGKVVSAIPGARGSTTTSAYLFGKAKEAALLAKFDASPEAADVQKGTMTFVFLVQ